MGMCFSCFDMAGNPAPELRSKDSAFKTQGSLRSQSSFRRSSSSLAVEEIEEERVSIKRSKSMSSQGLSPECLRVRTPAGGLLLSLTLADVAEMSVGTLRDQVSKVVGRCINEIKLLALLANLDDDQMVQELLPHGGETLEMIAVTSQMVQFDITLTALEQLSTLKEMIMSHSVEYQLDASTHLRKILSQETNPSIHEVIELGVVPRFVELCDTSDSEGLIVEAAWCLTNVAAGSSEQCQVVINSGALPIFVKLLASKNEDILEQAVWALGNIAGDSFTTRDAVIDAGVAQSFADVLGPLHKDKVSFNRNGMWALSNLFRGKPNASLEALSPVLPTLRDKLNGDDEETLTDACWAISYMSDGSNEDIDAVLNLGICARLVELLSHTSRLVRAPALRAVGNIATGEEQHTQAILDENVLQALGVLVSDPKQNIRKETCWTLSNILAGTSAQVQAVCDSDLIPPLVALLKAGDDVKKEAVWAISNATSVHNQNVNDHLIEKGALPAMVALLSDNSGLAQQGLEFCDNILHLGLASNAEHVELVKCALDKDTLKVLADSGEKASKLFERLYGDASSEE